VGRVGRLRKFRSDSAYFGTTPNFCSNAMRNSVRSRGSVAGGGQALRVQHREQETGVVPLSTYSATNVRSGRGEKTTYRAELAVSVV
jgi:hypothetical protein